MEEGAGVIFSIYDSAKLKVDELSGENKGGKAEAECVYHYNHDPENPLTEKPQFTFKAKALRAEEVESGTVEISQKLLIQINNPVKESAGVTAYTLYLPNETIEGKTGEDGIIEKENLIPGMYGIVIQPDEDEGAE